MLIIWLSFATITLTKMSYIRIIGIESGNLSKLVRGKFLRMFLNIVIKNWLNQYRRECGYSWVRRKPLTATLMPTIASRMAGDLGPRNSVHSGGQWVIKQHQPYKEGSTFIFIPHVLCNATINTLMFALCWSSPEYFFFLRNSVFIDF